MGFESLMISMSPEYGKEKMRTTLADYIATERPVSFQAKEMAVKRRYEKNKFF